MKIPLYRRQTQMTRDSGARNLTAMASGSDYAAPANAAFRLGATGVETGKFLADVGITEVKQENATMLANEQSKFSDFLFKTQQEILDGPVGQAKTIEMPQTTVNGTVINKMEVPGETQQQHSARLQSLISERVKKQAARIENSNVRRRFSSAAAAKVQTSLPGITATLRAKYLDHHRAKLNTLDASERRHVSTLTGMVRQNHIDSHARTIEEQGRDANDTEVAITKRIMNFRSNADEDLISQEMLAIENVNGKDKEEAYGVLKKSLLDPKNYTSLNPDARNRLLSRMQREEEGASSSYANFLNNRDKTNETKRRQKQVKTFDVILDRSRKYRAQIANGETPAGLKPTMADLRDARAVTAPQREYLQKVMNGEDIVTNTKLFADLTSQIDEAVTDEDLEEIKDDILEHAEDDRLGGKATTELFEQIDGLKLKTPDALQRSDYRKLLKAAVGGNATKRKGRADESYRESEIINYYNDLLRDGVTPGVAYVAASSRAKADTEEKTAAMIQSLPEPLYNLFEFKNGNLEDTVNIQNSQGKTEAVQIYTPEKILSVKSEMMNFVLEQMSGIEIKNKIEIDGIGGSGKRLTEAELGEAQRVDDPSKRMSQKDRMSVRALFMLEKRIDQITDLLTILGKKPAVAPSVGKGRGG